MSDPCVTFSTRRERHVLGCGVEWVYNDHTVHITGGKHHRCGFGSGSATTYGCREEIVTRYEVSDVEPVRRVIRHRGLRCLDEAVSFAEGLAPSDATRPQRNSDLVRLFDARLQARIAARVGRSA